MFSLLVPPALVSNAVPSRYHVGIGPWLGRWDWWNCYFEEVWDEAYGWYADDGQRLWSYLGRENVDIVENIYSATQLPDNIYFVSLVRYEFDWWDLWGTIPCRRRKIYSSAGVERRIGYGFCVPRAANSQ